jgi:hypothetical protein
MAQHTIPAHYESPFNWPRLLILHVLVTVGCILIFPAPANLTIGAVFMVLYAVRWKFFNKPAVILDGDQAIFQPMGFRYQGPVKFVNVRASGSNIIMGGWLTVDLKNFGRRRVTIFPILDPQGTAAVLKAAARHYQAVDRGEIDA